MSEKIISNHMIIYIPRIRIYTTYTSGCVNTHTLNENFSSSLTMVPLIVKDYLTNASTLGIRTSLKLFNKLIQGTPKISHTIVFAFP